MNDNRGIFATIAAFEAVLVALVPLWAYNAIIVKPKIRALQAQITAIAQTTNHNAVALNNVSDRVDQLAQAQDSLSDTVNANADATDSLADTVNQNAIIANQNAMAQSGY